jgi:hypothetical protein
MGKAEVWNPKKWETEQDLDAMCRAKAVMKDPKRMEECKKLAKERLDENKNRRDQLQMMVDMGEGKNP